MDEEGAEQADGDGEQVRHHYDRADLEAMVGFSFTDKELASYAVAWGVNLDPGQSSARGARKLIRTLDQEDRLHAFVEQLRQDKPLVEWPQPRVEAVDELAPSTEEDGPPTDESAGAAPPPDEASAPGAPAAVISDPGPSSLADPYVEQLIQETEAERVTFRDQQVWRRALLLAGVLVVGIGAGGVGMYVMFGPADTATESSEPEVPTSVAAAAADLVQQSVKNLGDACEIDEAGESARSTLTAAFRKCAVPEIVGRGRVDLPPPPPPDPAPTRPRMRLPGRTAPDPQPSRAAGCMDRCHDVHNSCKRSECGEEPASAADYPNYQRCLTGCQSKYSRCRMSCR